MVEVTIRRRSRVVAESLHWCWLTQSGLFGISRRSRLTSSASTPTLDVMVVAKPWSQAELKHSQENRLVIVCLNMFIAELCPKRYCRGLSQEDIKTMFQTLQAFQRKSNRKGYVVFMYHPLTVDFVLWKSGSLRAFALVLYCPSQ